MRLLRLSTRRLMMLVAVVAMTLATGRLSLRALNRYDTATNCTHLAEVLRLNGAVIEEAARRATSAAERRPHEEAAARHREHADYYASLAFKYHRAANRPWLPLAPDPPPPK